MQPRSRICVTGVSLGTLGSWGQGSGPRAVSTAGLGPGRHTVACCPGCLHHPHAGPKQPGREGGGPPGSPNPAAQGPRSHRCAPPTRWGQPSCRGWLRAQVSGPDTPHRMLLRRWACLPAASSLGFWSHRPGKLGGGGLRLVRAAPPRAESTSSGPAGVWVLCLVSWWVTQRGFLTAPGGQVPWGMCSSCARGPSRHVWAGYWSPVFQSGLPCGPPPSLAAALGRGAWGSPGRGCWLPPHRRKLARQAARKGLCERGVAFLSTFRFQEGGPQGGPVQGLEGSLLVHRESAAGRWTAVPPSQAELWALGRPAPVGVGPA